MALQEAPNRLALWDSDPSVESARPAIIHFFLRPNRPILRPMLTYILAAVALALWFGGGVVAGFVAPQAAFGVLADRAAAGSIAGVVLGRYTVISVASGCVYVAAWFLSRLSSRPYRKRSLVVVGAALLVIVFSQWYVSPQIAALRSQMATAGAVPELQTRFDSFHTLSVILFGVQWLLAGAALVLHAQRGQQSFPSGSR